MNRVDNYFRYMAFKSKLKNIPLFYPFTRYIKWKVYRPLLIILWTKKRNLICRLKEKGIIQYDNNDRLLMSLHNKYKGKIAFIIGNGPSLRIEDLEKLREKGIYSFGANRINLIYNKTHWRPNCYVAIDLQIYRNNDPTIFKQIDEHLGLYFLSKDVYAGIDKTMYKDNILYFHSQPNSYYKGVTEFSDDVMKYVVDGFTVTYTSIQMAYYMGFKAVYLLGVDCNYAKTTIKNGKVINKGGNTSYFTKDYDPKNSNTGYVEGMFQAYQMAGQFCKDKDFKVYNASRGGILEVFERVNFDDVINSIH